MVNTVLICSLAMLAVALRSDDSAAIAMSAFLLSCSLVMWAVRRAQIARQRKLRKFEGEIGKGV